MSNCLLVGIYIPFPAENIFTISFPLMQKYVPVLYEIKEQSQTIFLPTFVQIETVY